MDRNQKRDEKLQDRRVRRTRAQLREAFMDPARRRPEQLEQQEQAAARAATDKLDQRQAQAMAAVEQALAENEEKWTNTLFHMIVGGGA